METTESVEVNKELFGQPGQAVANEADIVFRARFRPDVVPDDELFFLIHLEHQSSRDYTINKRMHDYQNRLYHKYHMPVFGILVCSYDSPLDPEPTSYEMVVLGKPMLQYHYEVIQLNRMDWRDYRDRPNPVASALMAKMGVPAKDRVAVKLACYKVVAGLKLNRRQLELIGDFVETYVELRGKQQKEFEMDTKLVYKRPKGRKQTDLKELFRPVREERARTDAEVSMLLTMLRAKFDTPLTEDMEDQVDELEAADRQALVKAIFSFNTLQDAQDWLDQHSPAE